MYGTLTLQCAAVCAKGFNSTDGNMPCEACPTGYSTSGPGQVNCGEQTTVAVAMCMHVLGKAAVCTTRCCVAGIPVARHSTQYMSNPASHHLLFSLESVKDRACSLRSKAITSLCALLLNSSCALCCPAACAAGYEPSVAAGTCEACPLGSYSKDGTACVACPEGKSTADVATYGASAAVCTGGLLLMVVSC